MVTYNELARLSEEEFNAYIEKERNRARLLGVDSRTVKVPISDKSYALVKEDKHPGGLMKAGTKVQYLLEDDAKVFIPTYSNSAVTVSCLQTNIANLEFESLPCSSHIIHTIMFGITGCDKTFHLNLKVSGLYDLSIFTIETPTSVSINIDVIGDKDTLNVIDVTQDEESRNINIRESNCIIKNKAYEVIDERSQIRLKDLLLKYLNNSKMTVAAYGSRETSHMINTLNGNEIYKAIKNIDRVQYITFVGITNDIDIVSSKNRYRLRETRDLVMDERFIDLMYSIIQNGGN